MWRLMTWLDHRWTKWHARGTVRHDWLDRCPRLWTFTTVPLSTWLRHPATGWESYQAHIGPILLEQEKRRFIGGELGERDKSGRL